MAGASIQDRYGTESEKEQDNKVVDTLWKFSPTSYDNEKIVVLPYAHYQTLGYSSGVTAPYQFNINSIYDPDLTGGGFQPLGRDTWTSIYNYYKVLEAHVKVSLVEQTDDSTGTTGSNSMPSLHTFMADITATPPATLSQLIMAVMASKNNKQQKFGNIQVSDVINGRGSKTIKYEYHWDASQFDTSIIDNAKNEWTPVSSNPANLNYFSLISYNPQASSRTATLYIEIEYLTAFKQINRTLLNTVN